MLVTDFHGCGMLVPKAVLLQTTVTTPCMGGIVIYHHKSAVNDMMGQKCTRCLVCEGGISNQPCLVP